MDTNEIKVPEESSLSSSKRQRKQNMQMLCFLTAVLCDLPGFSAHRILGSPCTQGQTMCSPRQEGENNSVSSVRTSARPNESVCSVILASLNVSGGLHVQSR